MYRALSGTELSRERWQKRSTASLRMSALGQKRSSQTPPGVSALGQERTLMRETYEVRFGPEADIGRVATNVTLGNYWSSTGGRELATSGLTLGLTIT